MGLSDSENASIDVGLNEYANEDEEVSFPVHIHVHDNIEEDLQSFLTEDFSGIQLNFPIDKFSIQPLPQSLPIETLSIPVVSKKNIHFPIQSFQFSLKRKQNQQQHSSTAIESKI